MKGHLYIVNFTIHIKILVKRSCHTRRQLLENNLDTWILRMSMVAGCIGYGPCRIYGNRISPGYRYLTGTCQYSECIGRLVRSDYRLYSYRVLSRSLG